ncbi:hypothetical protein Tco_1189301 [Tanacetum coccineum]
MPVELGSFDVIIGMDWLRRCHAVIVCDEKLVQVPYGNETLTFCGNEMSSPGLDRGIPNRLNSRSRTRSSSTVSIGSIRTLKEHYREQLQGLSTKDPKAWFTLTLGSPGLIRQKEGWVIQDVHRLPTTKELERNILRPSLELLKKEKLYAKFSKCEFWIPKVQFLGHVIDSRGIHVDPAKIESIKDWASPKTPTKIRQFLGLAGYYRRFIEGFSKIAKSMMKLTQKGIMFN